MKNSCKTPEEKTIYKLNKLKQSLQKLKEGHVVHITCLMPIGYFFKLEESKVSKLAYAKFLITTSFELYQAGVSISVENNIPNTTKHYLYTTLLECLESLIKQEKFDNEQVTTVIHIIQTFYPLGCRCIAVHATRRKIFDVDLILLEMCARMLKEEQINTYWLIEMTKYFCVSYENLRYKMNQQSISRFASIIEYFEK